MFEHLPDDVLIDEILPRLPIPQLGLLCQTNSRIRELCNQPTIWYQRLNNEIPGVGPVPRDVSPMIFYFDALKWHGKTISDFPEAGLKPSNLLWSQYYRRLQIGKAHLKRFVFVDSQSQLITGFGDIKLIPGITSLRSIFVKAYNILKVSEPEKTIYGLAFDTIPSNLQVGNRYSRAQPPILLSNFGLSIYSSVPTFQLLQSPPWLNPSFDIVVYTMNKVAFNKIVNIVGVFGIVGLYMFGILLPLSFLPFELYASSDVIRSRDDDEIHGSILLWRRSHKIPVENTNTPILKL